MRQPALRSAQARACWGLSRWRRVSNRAWVAWSRSTGTCSPVSRFMRASIMSGFPVSLMLTVRAVARDGQLVTPSVSHPWTGLCGVGHRLLRVGSVGRLRGELVTCYLFCFRMSYSGKAIHRASLRQTSIGVVGESLVIAARQSQIDRCSRCRDPRPPGSRPADPNATEAAGPGGRR